MKDDAECFINGGQFESFVLFRPVPPAKKSVPALDIRAGIPLLLLTTLLLPPIVSFRLLSFTEQHDNKVISASVPLSSIDKRGVFRPISLSRWFTSKPFIVNWEKRGNDTLTGGEKKVTSAFRADDSLGEEVIKFV